jgi:hypothetical protein
MTTDPVEIERKWLLAGVPSLPEDTSTTHPVRRPA